MPLTLREVLSLEVVRRGAPSVVAAADRLDVRVRWVHVAEMPDAGRLLSGGELVLSTGIALPSEPASLAEFVSGLAGARAAGLAIELGRRYVTSLPPALVSAAETRGVPLIVFGQEIPFVEITEAVHARIIDEQHTELVSAQQVHSVFTSLSVEGAPADEIVRAAASLAGSPVVFADLSYRVLASSAGAPPEDFPARARTACEGRPRTFFASGPGWLVTTVGARGEDWGRLFLCAGPGSPPASAADTALLERAATTLALGRLIARQADSVERQAHRTLISAIISDLNPAAAVARARSMGVPVSGRQLVALVARIPDPGPGLSAHAAHAAHAAVDTIGSAIADACRDIRVPALVGSLDDLRAGALLSLPPHADTGTTLRQLTERLGFTEPAGPAVAGSPVPAVIGVGSPTDDLTEARQSFLDAREVADAAVRSPDGRPYYRLPDLRLRGLLHLLHDDPRLETFASRELGPLLAYDAAHGTSLLDDLAVYLECGGNKAAAAARAHLARPTFYQRLRLVERVLGVSLDSAESRTSLHVALLVLKPGGSGPRP